MWKNSWINKIHIPYKTLNQWGKFDLRFCPFHSVPLVVVVVIIAAAALGSL